MTIQAQVNWVSAMQFVGRSGTGPAVILDDHEGGSGPSPMELMLMAVAGCTAMDIVSILKKKRAVFTSVRVNIQGEQAGDYPKRFRHVDIEYVITGRGVKPKAVEQAISLSATKYCSAVASLNATVGHTYRIEEKDATAP
ncbi:MAG: OsmC family protein [Thermodesulfobacteriota bacterium]